MPLLYTIHSDGPDRTGLVAMAQRYIDELWVPTHLTPDQAHEFMLDQFKRAVVGELELLEVRRTSPAE